MYSEKQLNAMTKTTLVDVATDLQQKVEALSAGPLTSSSIERRLLDIQEKAITIAETSRKNERELQERLDRVQKEHDKVITELNIQLSEAKSRETIELADAIKSIEQGVDKAKQDLSFGLKKVEIQHQERIEQLEKEYSEKEESLVNKITKLTTDFEELRKNIEEQRLNLLTNHKRELEQLDYDHKIMIRDQKITTADQIARQHGKVIVEQSKYDELSSYKQQSEQEILEVVKREVAVATNSLKSSLETKHNAEKSQLENDIKIYQNNEGFYKSQVNDLKALVADLQSRLNAVPSQIADAVKAAKAEVVVNQDNKK